MGARTLIRWLHKPLWHWYMSILLALGLVVQPGSVAAHTIRPSISDVAVTGDKVTIDIRLLIETMLAGAQTTGTSDADAAAYADRYSALRALEPGALGAAFRKAWPQISTGFQLLAGGQRLELDILSIQVPPVGDVETGRKSTVTLGAQLPPDDSAVVFGWQAAYGPLVVRQVLDGGGGYTGYLKGGELSAPMPRGQTARQSWLTAFGEYVGIGFVHIIPKGLDHILFVLGLFFFSLHLRPLLFQVSAFTVAHTVALALAVLGIVQVSPSVVEPLIAASIVYVAVENILWNELRPWRTAVVFGFGLLHGLGFAAVLGDIGLDPGRFATGLIGFNVGVELGQLAVIASAFVTVGFWFGKKPWYRAVIARPISLGIAVVGGFWFIQRVFF
jgi:uncharacterized membrane protein